MSSFSSTVPSEIEPVPISIKFDDESIEENLPEDEPESIIETVEDLAETAQDNEGN